MLKKNAESTVGLSVLEVGFGVLQIGFWIDVGAQDCLGTILDIFRLSLLVLPHFRLRSQIACQKKN